MSMSVLLQRAQELPQPPKILQDLIASFEAPEVDIHAVTRKIATDQVLSAKMLRLANSARFGAYRNVTSINEAVIRLGFNAVRSLILATGMMASLRPAPGFDMQSFWRESLDIATLSKWLSQYSPAEPETAFTCGMMHNIGRLLIHSFMPLEAKLIDNEARSDEERLQLERQYLGFDHRQMGALLAERWQFPLVICDSVRNETIEGEAASPYASLVQIASYLRNSINQGEDHKAMMAGLPLELTRSANLDITVLDTELDQLADMVGDVEELIH